MKKFKKFLPLLILVIVALGILVWACLQTEGSESYNYEGYIVGISETKEGTVLTTLQGNTQSEFVVKRNTKEKFNGDVKELRVGDCIKLTTRKNSDRDIERFSVYSGFSMEGKIVNVEGQDTPFLLTPYYASYKIYSLIPAQELTSFPQTGTTVKIYYQYPINAATVSIVADIIQPTSDIVSPLTDAEASYIANQGYTVLP